MQAVAYKNGGLSYNWCALYLCICADYSSDKALSKLGIGYEKRSGTKSLKPRKSYPKKELNPALLRAEYEAGAMIEQLASKYKVAHQRITAAIREAGGTIRKRGGDDFGKKKNRFARLY